MIVSRLNDRDRWQVLALLSTRFGPSSYREMAMDLDRAEQSLIDEPVETNIFADENLTRLDHMTHLADRCAEYLRGERR